MNGLTVFRYHEQEIRTIEKDGETWWVLKDVCDALGLSDTNKISKRLDDDELTRIKFGSAGQSSDLTRTKFGSGEQRREMICVNEPGLYSVVLRSNKSDAKAFKRWITHEVIPTIRKTGRYSVGEPVIEDNLASDDIRALAEEVRRLSERINAMAPKRPTLPVANIDFTEADKKKWMRRFNARLDLLEEKLKRGRNEILHMLYEALEMTPGVILDHERLRCIEERNLQQCTTIEAIYYTPKIRKEAQQMIDGVLNIDSTDW